MGEVQHCDNFFFRSVAVVGNHERNRKTFANTVVSSSCQSCLPCQRDQSYQWHHGLICHFLLLNPRIISINDQRSIFNCWCWDWTRDPFPTSRKCGLPVEPLLVFYKSGRGLQTAKYTSRQLNTMPINWATDEWKPQPRFSPPVSLWAVRMNQWI